MSYELECMVMRHEEQLQKASCHAAYWQAVGGVGKALATALASTDRGQSYARIELAARLKEVTQILSHTMTPKHKKGDVVQTPYGKGTIQEIYKHALDPESPPQVWNYIVLIDDNSYRGLNPATFQEPDISPNPQ